MKIVCDFCSSPNVKYRLLATTDTNVQELEGFKLVRTSFGDWAACADCMSLVIDHNKQGLLERAIGTMLIPVEWLVVFDLDLITGFLRESVAKIHELFWKNYTGLYEEIGEE
jgi:hypothetical protein